jgi:hypothetical protein
MAIGMHAQDWGFNENAYSTHCVVYAHLVDASGNDVTERGYTLGAFIDGVCRGQQYTEFSSASAGASSWYFPIRIGGTSADNGKNITFKLWSFDGTEYAVSGTPVLTYQNEATLYQPSDCYGLLFKAATELSLPSEITVDVGETIDLLPLITVTPAGANMPTNLTWDYVNGGSYIDVTDNKLKGKAKSGDDRIYLGLDAGQLSTYTMVKVFQPITSMTLKSQYASGVTVNLNDVATLTNILNDCYVATPDDADEQPLWTSTNTSAIYQSLSGGWVPAMTGTYAMTLNSKNKSLTLNVTIKKGVTDVYSKTKYYRAEVGDDLSNLAAHGCGVTPEDATDKTLNVTVETPAGQATAAAVQINAEGKLMAVAPGTANVVFTSRDNPQISGLVVVEVYPKVTGIKVNQDPLSITYSGVNTDVSNAIKGNFSFLPSGVSVERQYYTIASSNQSVIESGGDWGDISTMTGKGQTTMSVTYTIWKTVYDAQTDTFVDEDKVVAKSFVVNVVEGLSGFSLSPVKMALGGTKTVKLTPQPAGAAYDASLITLSVGHGIGSGWVLAEAAKSGTDGLTWTLEAKSVGAGTITINYGTASYGSAAIEIGQQISYAPGWKWVSFYSATQPRDTIYNHYGEKLLEIRSQKQLLYNDPKYGYFGDLSALETGECYKIRVKDAVAAGTFVTYDNSYAGGSTTKTLNKQWNWLGNPYQYDQNLADALSGFTPADGDRIVSKDDGFAEYKSGNWTGTLTVLKNGFGYMYYNAGADNKRLIYKSETAMGQKEPTSNAKTAKQHPGAWVYNSAPFADNMTIIAEIPELTNLNHYSVGAFVDNECRGEGTAVEGKFFITVHGESGEQVGFMLYNTLTGEYHNMKSSVTLTKMAGTLTNPLLLAMGAASGIDQAAMARSGIAFADGWLLVEGISMKSYILRSLNGKTVFKGHSAQTDLSHLPSGVYIVTVTTTDGNTVSKKLVK